jgi:hypothetical protein
MMIEASCAVVALPIPAGENHRLTFQLTIPLLRKSRKLLANAGFKAI